jgi:ribosomal protein S18 acetylase RimI-like enzyme
MSSLTQRALTEHDARAYIALVDAICTADGDDRRVDEGEYSLLLSSALTTPGIEDSLGVFDGERLVAGGWVGRRGEADPVHWMWADGGVHPDFRGRGLGTRLLRWQESLAPRIHERHFPGRPMHLTVGTVGSNTGAIELFENEGYRAQRWFFSMRLGRHTPSPQAAVPAGLEIETYTDAVGESVRLLHNEVFGEHWHSVPIGAQEWREHAALDSFQGEISALLRDGESGEIAGYLIATFNQADFEATGVRDVHFNLIGTRRAYRGRGVASALIAHAVATARSRGFETASLHVDGENSTGALGVYERSGFTCEGRRASYGKELVTGSAA